MYFHLQIKDFFPRVGRVGNLGSQVAAVLNFVIENSSKAVKVLLKFFILLFSKSTHLS